MKKQIVLPKVFKHNMAVTVEGVGNRNQKEYCDCLDCVKLRKRRDSIFDNPYQKLKRWCNNHN